MENDDNQEIRLLKDRITNLESKLEKKYGLVWEDKIEKFDEDSRNSIPILTEKLDSNYPDIKTEQENGKSPHVLIEGDNYHTLSVLSYTHKGLVDLIYIDPPYNTGNDFVYNDKIIDKEDSFRHSKWLSFMNKRLSLAKDLLSEDGVMFISIDDNEQAQLKMLCNEIFGENNTKTICVQMSESSGLKMSSVAKNGSIPKLKEYVIVIGKNGVKNIYLDSIPKELWDREYNLFFNNFTKEDRRFIKEIESKKDVSMSDIDRLDKIANKIKIVGVETKIKELGIKDKDRWRIDNAYRIVRTAASKSVFRLVHEKKKIIKQAFFFVRSKTGLLYFAKSDFTEGAKNPRIQILFADDNLTKHPGDLWTHIKTTGLESEGGVEFKNGKKPLKLIKTLINSIKKENLTVLDFFSGSGTTCEAVLSLNKEDNRDRQCILATNNENNICEEVTYERVKRVMQGYTPSKGKVVKGLGGDLKYLKTGFLKKETYNGITDEDKINLTYETGLMIALKESTFNEIKRDAAFQVFESEEKIAAVYFSESIDKIRELLNFLSHHTKPIKLYKFSWGGDIDWEFEEHENIEVEDIPEPILEIYRNIGVL